MPRGTVFKQAALKLCNAQKLLSFTAPPSRYKARAKILVLFFKLFSRFFTFFLLVLKFKFWFFFLFVN